MVERVAMVCPYSLGVPGGVQGQAIGIAKALAALGVEVALIGPQAHLATSDAAITIFDAGRSVTVPANGSRAAVAITPAAFRSTTRALERFAPQVVHVHEPFVPGPALAALRQREAVTIGTFHRAGASSWYRSLRPIARRLTDRIDACCAVSSVARDTLVAVLGREVPCQIIENGLDVKRFTSATPSARDGFTLVFVGRHEPRKGLAVLLDAFAELTSPRLALWVIGTGPLSDSLRRQYQDDRRISWLGQVEDNEVAARLKAADLFIAPSLAGESFGVVLLEAMAAGCAVVASDLPGYRLAAGQAAEFVEMGDRRGLAQALRALIDDPGRRRELVADGFRRAAERDFTQLAEQYLTCYATAMGA